MERYGVKKQNLVKGLPNPLAETRYNFSCFIKVLIQLWWIVMMARNVGNLFLWSSITCFIISGIIQNGRRPIATTHFIAGLAESNPLISQLFLTSETPPKKVSCLVALSKWFIFAATQKKAFGCSSWIVYFASFLHSLNNYFFHAFAWLLITSAPYHLFCSFEFQLSGGWTYFFLQEKTSRFFGWIFIFPVTYG